MNEKYCHSFVILIDHDDDGDDGRDHLKYPAPETSAIPLDFT